ncbi:MAG TPA: two-component regulator propeller domain-containing protein, partial [Verrucomicrobiae bacterium]|nr:two-component regulator propeller domain-containing protein [Verrucomicrobiae bacterium]
TGDGYDILNGAVKGDDTSTNTLYFKFHVDPLSDASTEEYFAAFELYEGDKERFGIGNALKAWAYSAFRADTTGDSHEGSDYIDLHSSRPEPSKPGSFVNYENPHRGIECTIVFKVQCVPGGNDLVTVWLNPDLGPGASEAAQPENLITRFRANASFNEIHLRHGGGGDGWIFSDMALATSFSDFVAVNNNESGVVNRGLGSRQPLFTFQSWQSEQGLPQDYVRALAQTSDGYLWVGTDDGVARFDGVRFLSFGLPDGLPNGPARTLFADSHGALWIGSVGNGLIRWRAGQVNIVTMADGLPSDSVSALAEDSKGRLWIGTEAGLAVWQDGHVTPFAPGEQFKGKAITALSRDRQGNMWLGATGAGVFKFAADKFVPITDSATRELLQDPHCLLVDKTGKIWIGAGDDFVLCRDGDQWRPYRIPRHFARSYICALAEEPDGTVWAGSVSEGLFEFKNGKQVAFNASSGLSDNSVASLFVDKDGNLWVGTAAGLNLLQQKNLFAFDQKQGLGYGAVDALAEISPGQVWVGKQGDGLYRWDGMDFNRLMSADLSIIGQQINSLLVSPDGSCWVAGVHGLLHFKEPRITANRADLFTLPGSSIISLCEDRNTNLWVGTREGKLWCLRDENWIAQTNFTQTHAITAIVPDQGGALWIGTEGDGVYQFKGIVHAHLSTTNGLLSDLVRTLYLDAQRTLWIGTAGGGLSSWRQGRVTTITSREGLPDNTISQIIEDDTGHLWLGSNRGIACVSKRELEELAAGKVPAVYPQVYGRAEGMLSEQCTGGFFPSGLKSKSGQLWFSTLKGVVVVDPQVHLSKSPAPKVLLEKVWVDGVPHQLSSMVGASSGGRLSKSENAESDTDNLRLGPGKHRIELRYTALNFETPERTRFRYQLEGLDSDWVEAGTRRVAFYSYVPPGNYRFHVIACNVDGVWNDTGASLGLIVSRY